MVLFVKLSKTLPLNRISKTFAYLIMLKNWIETLNFSLIV